MNFSVVVDTKSLISAPFLSSQCHDVQRLQLFKKFSAPLRGPFLRTGDLGFIYDDELFITGRIKDVIIIRGQNHYPQDIELTVELSHSGLRSGCGAAFSVECKGEEQLVVVQEVDRRSIRHIDMNNAINDIRQAVTATHNLQLYAIVLVKPNSIPKTSSGKIRRRACRTEFLTGELTVLGDWSKKPRHKMKFQELDNEIESIVHKLSNIKKASM